MPLETSIEHLEQSDEHLEQSGSATQSVAVIACGAVAREILAAIEINQLQHIHLSCLPAKLHHYPEKIPEAVRAAIKRAKQWTDQIFVGYGDCGTGGLLDKVLEEEGVSRLPGAHCYAFFTGVDQFMARIDDEFTAFYLTDFLARQFDAMVVRPLGLDRFPELRDIYFGNYDRVIYLAQTIDPELEAKAQDAAKRLGLAYEYRFTGLGDVGRLRELLAPQKAAAATR